MIQRSEKRDDGIELYELKNEHIKVLVSTYGVTLMDIETIDREGNRDNVVLGYPTIEDYMARSGTYFGALVGRVCNRLAKGSYTLNGKTYQCAINNGPNSLHGGIDGFSYQNFEAKIIDDSTIAFTYHSRDMEEGYPGNLDLTCTLKLQDNTLSIAYDAISDQDTLCNLTHHTYFNLNGGKQDVTDHLLQIHANRHGCVDSDGLCIGQFREVFNTPLDFTSPKPVKDGLCLEDEQVSNAAGIDHHFILEDTHPQLVLSDPITGRIVEVDTTLPGMQLYSGNYISPCQGARNQQYDKHWGLAVEPQFTPDAIHNQEHPETILRAGTPFHQEITYTFKTDRSCEYK